jgi:tetratricopeptide (TPR) repeat protein
MSEAERQFERGVSLARDGRLAEAFEALEKCIVLDPDHARACKELARLSLRANELRAFTNWCHEASRIDEQDPEPYCMIAELLTEQGRTEEALEALGVAFRLRPLAEPEHSRMQALCARLRSV